MEDIGEIEKEVDKMRNFTRSMDAFVDIIVILLYIVTLSFAHVDVSGILVVYFVFRVLCVVEDIRDYLEVSGEEKDGE